MRRVLIALWLTLTAFQASAQQLPTCFIGLWKSDEALTLADVRLHPEISEKARALFEKNFFGRLVLIFGTKYGGSYLGEENRSELQLDLHDIVESGETYVILRDESLSENGTSKWFCEGDHIYTLVGKWEFREYFTRLE